MANQYTQKDTALSTKQLTAIAILSAIPSEYTTMEQVAQRCGVKRAQLYRWMDKKKYVKELEKQTRKHYQSFASKVRNAHIKYALQGNAQLIKLFYEHAEKWVPKTEQESNIKVDSLGDFLKGSRPDPIQQRDQK